MTEANIRKCKVCLLEKPRILVGKYPDGRNSKWVDQNDREWSGRTCPDCHVVNAKQVMKKIREL